MNPVTGLIQIRMWCEILCLCLVRLWYKRFAMILSTYAPLITHHTRLLLQTLCLSYTNMLKLELYKSIYNKNFLIMIIWLEIYSTGHSRKYQTNDQCDSKDVPSSAMNLRTYSWQIARRIKMHCYILVSAFSVLLSNLETIMIHFTCIVHSFVVVDASCSLYASCKAIVCVWIFSSHFLVLQFVLS